jgi:hypothetical protein
MLYTDFCNEFNVCLENGDYETANRLISRELGTSLAKRKGDFVSLLKGSGVPASIIDSNIDLINKFVENAPYNNKLRVGAALLVNSENQEIGFDGKKQINKENVRNCYRIMTNQYKNENQSNFAADPVSAIAQGVGELSKLGTTALQGKQQKRGAGLDYAKSKDAQRTEMLKSLSEKKKSESEAKSKSNRLLMIVGGSLLGLVVLGVTFYKLKKK